AAHVGWCADVAPGASESHSEIRHAVLKRGRLTAVLVIALEHRSLVDVVVLQRDELAVLRGAEPHALLGAGAMAGRLEGHLAAENQLDRLAQLSGGGDGERAVRPWPELAPEAGADEPGDDADILFGQPEHLRENAPHVEDALRLFVDRENRAVPHRGRALQLDRVVGL